MKLSEKIATMVWAFGSGDSRQHAVRQIAREVEDLEVTANRLREMVSQPVAHEHSPVVVDSATSMEPGPVAYVDHAPVDERKVAEAYREKVLAALREWGERPRDMRRPADVVMGVDLP